MLEVKSGGKELCWGEKVVEKMFEREWKEVCELQIVEVYMQVDI